MMEDRAAHGSKIEKVLFYLKISLYYRLNKRITHEFSFLANPILTVQTSFPVNQLASKSNYVNVASAKCNITLQNGGCDTYLAVEQDS